MNSLRSLDFFQKISVDNITKPTIVGSILSISAITIISFLLIREIFDLFTPYISRDSHVIQDHDHKTKINVNINIKFPNIPCNLISVDQEDSIGNHRMDISDTLTKQYVDSNGQTYFYDKNTINNSLENLYDALINNRGCVIEGYIPISKVPGDIHISFHNYGILYSILKQERKDLFLKLSMNHKISSLTFGEVAYNQRLLSRFGYAEKKKSKLTSKNDNNFNHNKNLPSYENEKSKNNYDYFIKLIPHYFEDNIYSTVHTGYQFSMTSKSRTFDAESEKMPIVLINYDFSPISMVLKLESKSLLHFLTHVCAIVGGVYVIFSILNRFFVSLVDSKE